jgi:predicted dehydrogenase
MHLGIIGCGSIGSRHARNAVAMGHVVELVDRDASRRSVLFDELSGAVVNGCIAYAGSHSSTIGHDVLRADAVLICTPATTHAEVARELLALGYAGPLMVEKPLALSVEDCAVFREWPHPTTMVGYNLRFHPEVAWLREAVPSPREVSTHINWDGRKYGNPLFEASHEIDLLRWLGCGDELRHVERFLNNNFILDFGERSWMEIDAESQGYRRWWFVENEHRSATVFFENPEELGTDMYRAELAHFLACVEKNEPTITPFADGIRVVEVCEQALKMAQEAV